MCGTELPLTASKTRVTAPTGTDFPFACGGRLAHDVCVNAAEEDDSDADIAEAEDDEEEEDYEDKKPAKKAKTSPKGKAAQSAGGKKGGQKSKGQHLLLCYRWQCM